MVPAVDGGLEVELFEGSSPGGRVLIMGSKWHGFFHYQSEEVRGRHSSA